jgi:hypothetical protein
MQNKSKRKETYRRIDAGLDGNYTRVESPRRGRAANRIGTGKAEQTSKMEEGGLFRPAGREVDD